MDLPASLGFSVPCTSRYNFFLATSTGVGRILIQLAICATRLPTLVGGLV